jgi:hypothetical protein
MKTTAFFFPEFEFFYLEWLTYLRVVEGIEPSAQYIVVSALWLYS